MSRWVAFSEAVVERLRNRVGPKVQRIVFALDRNFGQIHIDTYPSIVVVWGSFDPTVDSVFRSPQLVTDGDVRFSVLVVDRSDADALTTSRFGTPDEIMEEVTKALFGWNGPALADNPKGRVYLGPQEIFDIQAGVTTLRAEFRVPHRIYSDPGVNAP